MYLRRRDRLHQRTFCLWPSFKSSRSIMAMISIWVALTEDICDPTADIWASMTMERDRFCKRDSQNTWNTSTKTTRWDCSTLFSAMWLADMLYLSWSWRRILWIALLWLNWAMLSRSVVWSQSTRMRKTWEEDWNIGYLWHSLLILKIRLDLDCLYSAECSCLMPITRESSYNPMLDKKL